MAGLASVAGGLCVVGAAVAHTRQSASRNTARRRFGIITIDEVVVVPVESCGLGVVAGACSLRNDAPFCTSRVW